MSMFGTILEKLGLKKPVPQAAPSPQATTPPPQAGAPPGAAAPSSAVEAAPARPAAIAAVDVVVQLENLAKSNPQKLNWRVSIVDLLKLLDLDSSFAARKELATELGCPPEKLGDSAQMNMWLHKTVLQKLADNGGNIPQELLN